MSGNNPEADQATDDVEKDEMLIEDTYVVDPGNSLEELSGDLLQVLEQDDTATYTGQAEGSNNEDEEE